MINLIKTFALLFFISGCTNTPEMETGEIKTLGLIQDMFNQNKEARKYFDTRNIVDRDFIDRTRVPILFVELSNGKNGTLTQYPGIGDGDTWLAADGATITFKNGILKASRGMGNDIMGSSSEMAPWKKAKLQKDYSRKISFLTGNNKINTLTFECELFLKNEKEYVKIFDLNFATSYYVEQCISTEIGFINEYYVDDQKIVRRSKQYHSETLGYILTERLDR